MKNEIANSRQRIEFIAGQEVGAPARKFGQAVDCSSKASQRVLGWFESPRRRKFAGFFDEPASKCAVECNQEDTTGLGESDEIPPTSNGISEVMQNAGADNDIERTVACVQGRNIGLKVFNVADPELARPSVRVSEAG